jgi:hypothetical protein
MAEDSASPGTTKLHRLEENIGAIDAEFTNKVLSTASKFTVHGACYPELVEKMTGL